MSRIDEALKRASHGPHTARGPTPATEGPSRSTEAFTLNEYPVEDGGATRVEGAISLEFRGQEPQGRRATLQTEIVRSKAFVDQQLDGKLVVGATRDVVSIEQYRRLAANLHDAQVEKGLKTVMVTSAAPREGKSLTVVNLALTLSESYGRRVLLVDADLRRPSIHEVLGIPNERGLTDVLAGKRVEPPLIHLLERLWVLPSGRAQDNPLAGLTSEQMHKFLENVVGMFDWVLLDTPPVGLLPDARVLGRLVQAAVFVIRAGMTSFETVDRAIADLGRDCIIGTVLNGVEPSTLPTTSYYSHYYSKR